MEDGTDVNQSIDENHSLRKPCSVGSYDFCDAENTDWITETIDWIQGITILRKGTISESTIFVKNK